MYADTKAAVPAKADRDQRTGMIIPTIDMINTGRNILRLRKQQNLSVRDLQDIFGLVTPQAIYKWQRGSALPSLDNLVVLSAVFGVSIDDILALAEPAQELLGA